MGNWGLAIIMLTLFVKLLTFYPTQRAMMSGKKMQRLAPKMQALRKKFENDKQRLGVETMNLYKQEGVSPFGGCLPTLITMPIWIALFSTLNYAVEMHRAPFFGYIRDLSVRDPYFITPAADGRRSCTCRCACRRRGPIPQQQKMMAIMMPVMFTGFSLFLPAGLAHLHADQLAAGHPAAGAGQPHRQAQDAAAGDHDQRAPRRRPRSGPR